MLTDWLKKQKKRLIIGSILASFLLSVFVVNTVIIYHKLNVTEREDVSDGNHKQAKNIEDHLTFNSMIVKAMADNFSEMPEHLLTKEFIDKKAEEAD